MNHMETKEALSNNTNLIPELLNTSEKMQSSTVPVTTKMQLQVRAEEIENCGKISEPTKQNLAMTLQQSNNKNSTEYDSDMEDLSKLNLRHVHIPYILNGELYQIQTQDGENVTVKCCHCPPDRVYRGSVRSTGNFHMHIKRRHPDLLEKLHDMKVTALLERRDRLMRNRKVTHRYSRNRPLMHTIDSKSSICTLNSEDRSEIVSTTPVPQFPSESTPELSLMYTHKLKIKTVFQRHQMQKREEEEMRNWNNAEYVVMPTDKIATNEECEQPINYSLKSKESVEIQPPFSSDAENVLQQQEQEMEKSLSNTNQTSYDSFTNLNNQQTNLSITNSVVTNINNNTTQQNEYNIYENHANRSLSTPSISLSCPSILSTYSNNHHYERDVHRSYNTLPLHIHNLSIIKPEQLPLAPETEAIDLSIQTDSGIFSNSEDSGSFQNNDIQQTNTAGGNIVNNTNGSNTANWQQLLMHIENSLRDIQREMNVRNQIESNRMFLDIAKFKHLNPDFQFNW